MDTNALLRHAGTVSWRILRAGLLTGADAVLRAARAELDAALAAERKG